MSTNVYIVGILYLIGVHIVARHIVQKSKCQTYKANEMRNELAGRYDELTDRFNKMLEDNKNSPIKLGEKVEFNHKYTKEYICGVVVELFNFGESTRQSKIGDYSYTVKHPTGCGFGTTYSDLDKFSVDGEIVVNGNMVMNIDSTATDRLSS